MIYSYTLNSLNKVEYSITCVMLRYDSFTGVIKMDLCDHAAFSC